MWIDNCISGVRVMRKRDRIKRMTRKQIERLIAKAKKTWISVSDTLEDGKWDKKKEEED